MALDGRSKTRKRDRTLLSWQERMGGKKINYKMVSTQRTKHEGTMSHRMEEDDPRRTGVLINSAQAVTVHP